MKSLRRLFALAPAFIVLNCTNSTITPPLFDGDRAFGLLKAQVDLGPRVPGTPASAAARSLYRTHFESAGLEVDSQKVSFVDPYSGDTIPLVNLIARQNPTAQDRIIFAAHYDCRPRSERAHDTTKRALPIDGANDGASGVAVLMELANLFKAQAPSAGVDLVLFDGEDWGMAGELDYYSLGSKAFVRSSLKGSYRFGIVLDMIGDKDQQIFREKYSEQFAKHINDLVWSVAAKFQVSVFKDSAKHSVIDDHLPLNVVGIPAVDLIDFDYPFWHTEMDTPDKCSAESLANVGRVVAYIAYNKHIWPKK